MNAFDCPNSRVTAAECGTAPARPFGPLVDSAAALAAHERMPAGRVYDKLNAASEDARLIAEALEARRLHDAAVRAKYKALMKERARERGRINEANRRARVQVQKASGMFQPKVLSTIELAAKREKERVLQAKRRERLRLAAQRHHENSAGAVRAEAKQRG